MPEMHKEVRTFSHLKGVILADTVFLRPQFSITATTVVVANHIVMEGKSQHLFDNRKIYYIFSATPAVAIWGVAQPLGRHQPPPPFAVIAGLKLPLNYWASAYRQHRRRRLHSAGALPLKLFALREDRSHAVADLNQPPNSRVITR